MSKPIKKASQAITDGLAAFLIVGLTGCGDKEDPNCKDLAYAPQWRIDECKQQDPKPNSYGGSSPSSNNTQNHSSGVSWLPLFISNMLNSNNQNTRGYTAPIDSSNKAYSKSSNYTWSTSPTAPSTTSTAKSSGFFSSSSSSSSSSGG